jgi:NAD(P)-dependent dehydrogenase (short-subunit alcohol dehydrogenase family)
MPCARRTARSFVINLDGRTVLVTGAGGAIGNVTARVLADAGARVIAHYLGEAEFDVLEEAMHGIPAERRVFVDASFDDPVAGTATLWQAATAWQPRIDAVVLNAAMMQWAGLDDDVTVWRESWDRQLAVNVLAPVELMRLAVHHFRPHGGGILVTVGSWNAQRGASNPDQIGYSVSEAAVMAAAKTIARGYAADNILSYIVSPGIVGTWMSYEFADRQGGAERVLAQHPLKEFIPPKEIAQLIAFLASGTVRHLNGATLDVNGGAYIR